MTEIERQLTKALRRLSGQYKRDQKELAGEYERLAADYGRIVKVLGGQ